MREGTETVTYTTKQRGSSSHSGRKCSVLSVCTSKTRAQTHSKCGERKRMGNTEDVRHRPGSCPS